MTTAAEYRSYAQECILSARDAASDPVRKQFLELAKLWMNAANALDAQNLAQPRSDEAGRTNGRKPPTGAA
jgi:hypothetical protein